MMMAFASKEDWLRFRATVVTATDAKTLLTRNPTAWRELYEQKKRHQGGDFTQDFAGNAYTRWGVEREPAIADYVRTFVTGDAVEWNDPDDGYQRMWVGDHNPRFACTPDMIGGGTAVEIKTHKPGLDLLDRYRCQLAWQRLVLADQPAGERVVELLIAGEARLDGEDGFTPGETVVVGVEPDSQLQEQLVEAATEFITWLDSGVAPGWISDATAGGDDDVVSVVRRYKTAKAAYTQAAEVLKAVETELKGLRPGPFTLEAEGVKVSVSRTAGSQRFDASRFKKEQPEVAARYMKKVEGSTRLTVTPLDKEEV